jgi:hypothetical protein
MYLTYMIWEHVTKRLSLKLIMIFQIQIPLKLTIKNLY